MINNSLASLLFYGGQNLTLAPGVGSTQINSLKKVIN